ncbi:MAG: hypothetical protein JSV36_01375 [Anaerolineae bacterium]|nr:MAG: hypothetical protein JSV36_01375 [Anaerolineae bacterium]
MAIALQDFPLTQQFLFRAVQAVVVGLDATLMARTKDELGVGTVYPSKDLLVIEASVTHKADGDSGKQRTGDAYGTIELAVLADKISRAIREPVGVGHDRFW